MVGDEEREAALGAGTGGAPVETSITGASGMDGAARVGRLLVVGTPIGNLGDLSRRAIEAFASADAVCCEDTRVTSKLLAHAGLSRPLVRCDENVIAARASELIGRMLAGETLAFASDAGMPSVSDPGQVLVDAALEAGVDVVVVPGPSACVTALVASGIVCDHFFFEGFLPRKEGERARRLQRLAAVPGALIFYESPHRTLATVEAIARVFPERVVALCRELTKLHEEVLRAPAPQLAETLRARDALKGEVVLVVAPPLGDELAALERASALAAAGAAQEGAYTAGRTGGNAASQEELLREDISAALDAGESASSIAKRLSQKHSLRKRAVYDMVLELQEGR